MAARTSKELFLLFMNHVLQVRKSKAALLHFHSLRSRWGEAQTAADGWHPHPSPRVGWGGHGMAGLTKDLHASRFLDGPRSFWLRQPEICNALPQRSLRSGNVFSFWCGKRTKLYKRFPKLFFVVVIVAIETSGFRLRRSGFSLTLFSAYKLTPEKLNTFPWKCY